MSTDPKDTPEERVPSLDEIRRAIAGPAENEFAAAAFVISDAAELIALAACCAAETQRLGTETLRAYQAGEPVTPQTNEYAELLHDLLAGREVPVPIRPRRAGEEDTPVPEIVVDLMAALKASLAAADPKGGK